MSGKTILLINVLFIFACSETRGQQSRDFENVPFVLTARTNPARVTPSDSRLPSRSQFRTYNGTNNNLSSSQRLVWGATDIELYRELPAEYASTDPKNAMNGVSRPTARKISNVVSDEPVTQFSSRNLSTFVYVWGQFLDHDITLTPTGTTEYVPVLLPPDEPMFTESIPFFRSEVHAGTGVRNARQQTNITTAWIDGSMVYGPDETRARWLRTLKAGKMKTSSGNFLPWNTINNEQTGAIDPTAPSMGDDAGHTVKTIVTGDIRGAEHPGITSLHTIFIREHNRICDRLYTQGYRNDEDIYQRARKEVGAIIQAITFQEFLPAMGLTLSNYRGYNYYERPDIANTFATAGYRIGHTMVADEIALRNNACEEVEPGELDLGEVFNAPHFVNDFGLEPFLKGFATHKQYETDTKVNSVLRNFLFGNVTDPVRFGIDLASLNIQRGRDHGLPDYNKLRKYYTGRAAVNFSEITSNTALAASLRTLYGTVNNIDLWVGILAEDRLPGKSVGKTMHAMLKVQFEKLRDADYYFYRNDPYLPFLTQLLLYNTKLSDVIKRNTSLTTLQSNVFFIQPCPGENGEDKLITSNSFERTLNANDKASNEKLIVDEAVNSMYKIYPNPASTIVTIELGQQDASSIIEVLSSDGMMIKKLTTLHQKQIQIDVTGFAKGLYVVNIKGSKESRSLRFVKL